MDLDGMFKRAFDGFGSDPDPSGFPGFPGTGNATGNGQRIDINGISRCSRISRSEKEDLGSDRNSDPEKFDDFFCGDRAREAPFKSPGNTGTPGNEAKTAAISTSLQFPVKDREPGTPGTESSALRASFLDLNTAAPQRSDWWTGPAMAEVDALAPPPADPLPISPADVRAGVQRELRALAALGVTGPEAAQRAFAITRAKIGNSPALAERQSNTKRCHGCGAALRDDEAAVAVLNPGGAPLHLHQGCHDDYRARRRAIVDRIMAAAGFGAEAEGEAA